LLQAAFFINSNQKIIYSLYIRWELVKFELAEKIN
jgi:hypothetical protein